MSCYLKSCQEPPWTSYFVKYSDVIDDHRGMSHFNWPIGESNYHVLRTGCYPYIKYHCTRRPPQDLTSEDKFFKAIKLINLGWYLLYKVYNIYIKFCASKNFHDDLFLSIISSSSSRVSVCSVLL